MGAQHASVLPDLHLVPRRYRARGRAHGGRRSLVATAQAGPFMRSSVGRRRWTAAAAIVTAIVGDDFARLELPFAPGAEEVVGGCVVHREGRRDEAIEVAQPEESQPREPSGQRGAKQGANEVVDAGQ